MSVSVKQIRGQLESAYTLLTEDTTTLEKIEKLKPLLMGINPTLDQKLDAVMAHVAHLKAAFGGDLIHLASHTLPAKTESDKKRKKALLLFITSWKSLKSEVKRIQGYLPAKAGYDESLENSASTAGSVAKTGLFAKGPFGLITLAAVAVVGVGLLLRGVTTTVTIENTGCPQLLSHPSSFPIPGLSAG
jgi:hypothetical protein